MGYQYVPPVFGASGPNHSTGLVVDPGAVAGATRFLREDQSWQVPAGGGGGGAVTLIQQQVLVAPAATINFAAIPGSYNSLRLIYMAGNSATGGDLYVQFNGDSAAHYDRGYQFGSGSTQSTNQQFNLSTPGVGSLPGAGSQAGFGEMNIPYYSLTVFNKGLVATGGTKSSGPTMVTGLWFLNWQSTAAITSILLGCAAGGNFTIGSAFALYGII